MLGSERNIPYTHDFSAQYTKGSRWPRPVDVEISYSISVDFARVHALHLRMPLLPGDDWYSQKAGEIVLAGRMAFRRVEVQGEVFSCCWISGNGTCADERMPGAAIKSGYLYLGALDVFVCSQGSQRQLTRHHDHSGRGSEIKLYSRSHNQADFLKIWPFRAPSLRPKIPRQ